jgi:ATP synthase F1 complex assembly factor 2
MSGLLKHSLVPSALHHLEQALVTWSVVGSGHPGWPLKLQSSSNSTPSTGASYQQMHTITSSNSNSSSLRSDLGSGSALGTHTGFDAGSSDTAARRQSLLSKEGKRFYDTVQVQPCPIPPDHPRSRTSSSGGDGASQGYQLLLRKYPVKTPAKKVLVLPTLSLALAVAAEWECLPSGKPAPHRMPLTGLACTAIDQPKAAASVIEHLMKYVHTDGACIRCV